MSGLQAPFVAILNPAFRPQPSDPGLGSERNLGESAILRGHQPGDCCKPIKVKAKSVAPQHLFLCGERQLARK